MNIEVGKDGFISGSNRQVEFQVILRDKEVDLDPLRNSDDLDGEANFRGAPYSYMYEEMGNFISAMGWDAGAVLYIVNFFLKYLGKEIDFKDIKLDEKVRRMYE